MGIDIGDHRFTAQQFARFSKRLQECLEALAELLERRDFGVGEPTIGAELEFYLTSREGRPAHLNHQILEELDDPHFTVELNQFNLEYNAPHCALVGAPLTHISSCLHSAVERLSNACSHHDAVPTPIGILPTLRLSDVSPAAMSDLPRYRALSLALRQLHGFQPFHIVIDGAEPLEFYEDDVTLEGAATSLQLHLRVSPADFAATYNAAQLATAPALAAATNSPLFAGHALWDETRIVLFKQAVDFRRRPFIGARPPARVAFGRDWVRSGIHELFEFCVNRHEPLLPVIADEDPRSVVRSGGVPQLSELRLHNGTVWSWNRPVYDPADGGHVRIEFRSLPAGPSILDMTANAAFLLGLTLALKPRMNEITGWFDFEEAHNNFYRAAQKGLQAHLTWPDLDRQASRVVQADELVAELTGVARQGLVSNGVQASDVDPLLDVMTQRARTGLNGAVWQRRALAELSLSLERPAALVSLFQSYLDQARQNIPVHRWSIPKS